MQTGFSQIDNHVDFNPGEIVVFAGNVDAIEAVTLGLTTSAPSVQWILLSDQEFVPMSENIEVFRWNKSKNCAHPKEGGLVVLDGMHAIHQEFSWKDMLGYLKTFVDEHKVTVLFLFNEEEGTSTTLDGFLPEDLLKVMRESTDNELCFAQKNFNSVECHIRKPKEEEYGAQTVDLGSPGELKDCLIS